MSATRTERDTVAGEYGDRITVHDKPYLWLGLSRILAQKHDFQPGQPVVLWLAADEVESVMEVKEVEASALPARDERGVRNHREQESDRRAYS